MCSCRFTCSIISYTFIELKVPLFIIKYVNPLSVVMLIQRIHGIAGKAKLPSILMVYLEDVVLIIKGIFVCEMTDLVSG